MSLTLNDALSHYRSVSDSTHKFWAYFQVVAAGTAAFAWSKEVPNELRVFIFLSIAFAVFTALNGRLVVGSQAEAFAASKCVKDYALNLGTAVPKDLLPIVNRIDPGPAWLILVFYVGLSFATLSAVWWRYFTLAC